MTRLEPGASIVKSDLSTNCATAAAQLEPACYCVSLLLNV